LFLIFNCCKPFCLWPTVENWTNFIILHWFTKTISCFESISEIFCWILHLEHLHNHKTNLMKFFVERNDTNEWFVGRRVLRTVK
jgi:hypothetical protein